jgi:hypothetical protein
MITFAGWQEMRGGVDVTADDPSIDGLTKGRRLTDFTANRYLFELQPGAHMVQVGFHAEGPGEDATASFGCELWAAGLDKIPQRVCDITGLCGPAIADLSQADLTTRLFYDDLTVADTTEWLDVTTGNLLSDGLAWVCFSSRGARWLWPRFYNVGDATEADRIKALVKEY